MQGLGNRRDRENRRQGVSPAAIFHRAVVGILYTVAAPLTLTVQTKYSPQLSDSVPVSILDYRTGRVGKLYTELGLAFPW